jgi:ribosomal protein L14E/L6E/L27E
MPPLLFNASNHHQQAIHLFRALLRECSYLPDSIARAQISRQIIHRFRTRVSRGNSLIQDALSPHQLPERHDEAAARLEKQLKSGYRALGTLQRANNGGYISLTKVMFHAYGRTGKRRRELLASLLEADGINPIPGSAVDGVTARIGEKTHKRHDKNTADISTVPVHAIFEQPKDVSKDTVQYKISSRFGRLKAIAESQAANDLAQEVRGELKTSSYKMPAKNIWGRSMPRSRVKNLVASWYAKLMDRIHPPLPDSEWKTLKELIDGKRGWGGLRKRRSRILHRTNTLTTMDLEKLTHFGNVHVANQIQSTAEDSHLSSKHGVSPRSVKYINEQDSWLEDDDLVTDAVQQALEEELQFGKRFSMQRNFKDDPHVITSRYMRRIWARVFKHCPRLQRDESRNAWVVEWGHDTTSREMDPNTLLPLFEMVASPPLPDKLKA